MPAAQNIFYKPRKNIHFADCAFGRETCAPMCCQRANLVILPCQLGNNYHRLFSMSQVCFCSLSFLQIQAPRIGFVVYSFLQCLCCLVFSHRFPKIVIHFDALIFFGEHFLHLKTSSSFFSALGCIAGIWGHDDNSNKVKCKFRSKLLRQEIYC